MDRRMKRIAGATAGSLMLVGSGAALASSGVFDAKETSQEIIDGAAEKLGVSSSELSDALRAAFIERVDAALEAGEISEDEATAVKERIISGDIPLVGGFGHPGGPRGHWPGGFEIFGAATDYLGLSTDEIRDRSMDGQTLAEIAGEEDKSVDGLIDALIAAQKASVQEAVNDGRVRDRQKDELLEGLEDLISDLVRDGIRPMEPSGEHFKGFRGGPGW
jgi:hypothetical protein